MTGLSLKDIDRMNKHGWSKTQELKPAEEGIAWEDHSVKQQNTRNRQIADVLDIGAGTRCKHCGMLHFCWMPQCGACGLDMDYNLGKTEAVR